MLEFEYTKELGKKGPFAQNYAFHFLDSELEKDDVELIKTKIKEYDPLITGFEVNKDLSQVVYHKNIAHIAVTLILKDLSGPSIDEIKDQIIESFTEFYDELEF